MKYRYLITGAGSGIGQYLLEHLPGSRGLVRDNFPEVEKHGYDTIVHCAFNKERVIRDHYRYLDDNIFLTQRILDRLSFRRLVYLSSIDVYGENSTPYALCKRFAEAIVSRCDDYTILRCSTMLGPYMKPNHLAKLLANDESIGLSEDSSFNYILYDDLLAYFRMGEAEWQARRIVDFVAVGNLSLKQVKEMIGSSVRLGHDLYSAPLNYPNPIYRLSAILEKTSEENLRWFLGKERK